MKKYMLNDLGEDWIWEADSKEEATKLYLEACLGVGFTLEKYEAYCNDIGIKYWMDWKEIEE